VGLPNEAQEEAERAQGHESNRFECLPHANRKRPSGHIIAVWTSERGNATGSCSSENNYDGRNEEDPQPAVVTSRTLLRNSGPDQAVVQEEAKATPDDIPFGWTRTKLEPDW
jgi:hypothetical protein